MTGYFRSQHLRFTKDRDGRLSQVTLLVPGHQLGASRPTSGKYWAPKILRGTDPKFSLELCHCTVSWAARRSPTWHCTNWVTGLVTQLHLSCPRAQLKSQSCTWVSRAEILISIVSEVFSRVFLLQKLFQRSYFQPTCDIWCHHVCMYVCTWTAGAWLYVSRILVW